MDPSAAIGLLMTPQGRRDPYPAYAALHEHGPAIGLGDQVIVNSYEHANAVLRDPSMRVVDRDLVTRRFGEPFAERPAQRLLNDSVLNTNPPEHRAMRQLVAGAFTPRRVAALEATTSSAWSPTAAAPPPTTSRPSWRTRFRPAANCSATSRCCCSPGTRRR